MKILITGVGCIGKSSLREKVALAFPNKVVTIDMDYAPTTPDFPNKVIIIEYVHGLEDNLQLYDRILYLLPPRNHIFLWFKRAWAWFSTGIVDLSAPKGKRKRFALTNIPIILKIVHRNIFNSMKWVKTDIEFIQKECLHKTVFVRSTEKGFRIIESWIQTLGESAT